MSARPVVGLALLALGLLEAVPAQARAPVFEMRALGVLGGEDDGNLSCYLLGKVGEPPRLMLDGGSVLPGVARWMEKTDALPHGASHAAQAKATSDVLAQLQALLVTHSHLDHISGFLLASPLLLAVRRAAPLELIALPDTVAALRTHLLTSPVWLDLTATPPGAPVLKVVPLPPETPHAVGGFEIETIPLTHTVPSAAFAVRAGRDVYLHLGDTGPTEAVWERARAQLKAKQLRAIAVEVSFPSAAEALAVQTGHLTPRLLLVELNKLARAAPTPATVEKMTPEETRALAARLAPVFRECPIVAIHIKATGYDTVAGELEELRRAGLNVVIPQQGEQYRF